MSQQHEAVGNQAKQVPLVERLESVPADARLAVDDGPWSAFFPVGKMAHEAAAELRRLHDLADKYKWQVRDTCARAEKAEVQRDELLSALNAMLTHMGMDEDDWNKPTFDQARAAIAKAEEQS